MTSPGDDTADILRSILIGLEPALEDVELDLDDRIFDLGVDSMTLVSAIGEVEDRFGITLPDGDLVELDTLGDLVRMVDRHRAVG